MSPTTNAVNDFAELFHGREDAYGQENGGCARLTGTVDWARLYSLHLSGEQPIGVYPIKPHPVLDNIEDVMSITSQPCVKWGCVDFDIKSDSHVSYDYETEEEAHVAAVNLQRALAALGIQGWIERTRSGGRHVWVFASAWMPARGMRRGLLVASQLVGTPTREVNPKQEELAEGQLGNYVRLPYPGGLAAGYTQHHERMMLNADGEQYPFVAWVGSALGARSEPYVFKAAAELWVPPKKLKLITHSQAENDFLSVEIEDLLHELNGLGFTIWRDGPLNEDRSAGLYKLACVCRESGLSAADALAIVTDADARWGKFSSRADGEEQLRRTVERAYS